MAQPLVSRCPACGALGEPDARACRSCGADLGAELVPLVEAADGGSDEAGRRRRHRPVVAVWGAVLAAVLVADLAAVVVLGPGGCRPSGTAGGAPFSGRCSGTVLVVEAGPRAVLALDLDRGRAFPVADAHLLSATAGVTPLSPSDGRLPVIDHGQAWAVPVVAGSPAVALGPADQVVDDGTGGWWLISRRGIHNSPVLEARRVSGAGVGVGAPLFMSPGVAPLAGTAEGLLVTAKGGGPLALVGGVHPGPLHTGLTVQRVIAAARDRVLVVAGLPGHPDGLWILDLAGGGALFVGAPGRIGSGVGEAPGAKFSPDGRWLALFTPYAGPRPHVSDQLTLVDLRRGTVGAITGGGTVATIPSLAWSADSRWVFFLQGGGPTGRTIGQYRIGDRAPTALDYYAGAVEDLAGVGR